MIGVKKIFRKVSYFGRNVCDSCINLIDFVNSCKLRIALISFYYESPTISGVGSHVRNLAKYLARNNCDVHVFCSGEEEDTYKEENVVVHIIPKIITPIDDSYSKKRMEYDLYESEVVKEITREHTRKPFDIIHSHGSLTKAAFILKKVYNIKWVHTFHAIERQRAEKLSFEEKQYIDMINWIESTVKYCDGAIFVSNKLKEECSKYYKIKKNVVIPNGVDLELFRQSHLGNRNVLFIGRFSKEKGIELLPDLIPIVLSVPDASITMISPYTILPKDLANILSRIKSLEQKYPQKIKLIDKTVYQEDLVQYYKNSQIYIQPSKYESFGLCILEAMAVGRPIVAFNVGGIPEVVGNAGILASNKSDLLNSVSQLLQDRKKCSALGNAAMRRAAAFSWDSIARSTVEYYYEVLK